MLYTMTVLKKKKYLNCLSTTIMGTNFLILRNLHILNNTQKVEQLLEIPQIEALRNN
jgi:hypothetical protein